jgi:dTDP-4-dehydrorhamnose 3,5-epimerase
VEISELAVRDSYVLDLVPHGDARGSFVEWFRADVLSKATGYPFPLAQANHSVSGRGALRGVHCSQVPPGQGKYVYCPAGEVLDVVVDLRVGSPTFGEHSAVRLDGERPRAVFVPEGVGHAFLSLVPASSVVYLVSTPYAPEREFGIDPMDPELGLPWPADLEYELSAKDRSAPSLAEARERGLLPTMDRCTARYTELRATRQG